MVRLEARSHLSMWSFCANSLQSLPLALAVSKVLHILWRMERGILKALGPVWNVTGQSAGLKTGAVSFSLWKVISIRLRLAYISEIYGKDLQFTPQTIIIDKMYLKLSNTYYTLKVRIKVLNYTEYAQARV